MIELKEITKNYYDGSKELNVLKKTSITINKKEFTVIVGPSGSGKSTLLTIVGALQKPTSGKLYIDNVDVYTQKESKLSDLRFHSIGFVLQGSNLVPYLTIYEQFKLKLKQAKRPRETQKIDELLKELSIEHIKNKYPEDISGGERQRAAKGLALLLEPEILLADEPTASLDTEKAFQVVKTLKKVSKELDTAVVMVTHDRRMLSYCDRILEMEDGVLTEKQVNYN